MKTQNITTSDCRRARIAQALKRSDVKYTIIYITSILALAVCLFACDKPTEAPTRADCIAYWTRRTSTWDNPPSPDTIATDPVYCGNIK